MPEGAIAVGKITAAHGLKGITCLRSFCEIPSAIADYQPLLDSTGQPIPLEILDTKPNGILWARIDGVTDRSAAEALRGTLLYALAENLPKPEAGEYLTRDLTDLEVRDADGRVLGHVRAVHNFGAGDLLEIDFLQGGDSELFRFSDANFPHVSIAEGYLTFQPPEVLEAKP